MSVGEALEKLKAVTNTSNHKRTREGDDGGEPESKKAKSSSSSDQTPEDDQPLYTLHAISVSSPIRKKLDVTIHKSSIRFANAITKATELSIPISHLKRAFLLPTRGKTKPHWTVLIMSSDMPVPTGKASAAATKEEQPQIVFGVDAVTAAVFLITDHTKKDVGGVGENPTSSSSTSHPKGTSVLPHLHAFLSHLPFRTLEPSTAVFKSAVSTSGDGTAGVEGYRGAKNGTLWFFSEGLLWDGKPGEFWSVADLVGGKRGKGQVDVDLGGAEGVRTVSATGRSCSVIICRKVVVQGQGDEEDQEEEEEESVDTDVGMVDGKEQEGIARWVKKHRHLFGVAPVAMDEDGTGKQLAVPEEDDSDEDDSDFEGSSSDGGSPSSSSGEDEDVDAGGSNRRRRKRGGDDDDAMSEDLGSGSERSDSEDGDAEDEGDANGANENEDDEEDTEEEDEDLDPARHPLLRPGAMPRMSRAAIDAVVGMVENDLMGGATSLERRGANDTGESVNGDEEEDELDD